MLLKPNLKPENLCWAPLDRDREADGRMIGGPQGSLNGHSRSKGRTGDQSEIKDAPRRVSCGQSDQLLKTEAGNQGKEANGWTGEGIRQVNIEVAQNDHLTVIC